MEGTVMKNLLSLVASLVITFGVLGTLDWNMIEVRTPRGEVTVTQLPHPSAPALLAQVKPDRQVADAGRL
jgi:hypothetical protein